jgi:small Trp-rich protein
MHMYFVGLGLLLLLFKVLEYGPIAQWPWWGVLLPFGAAVVWWAWADATGYTKRREVDKMNERVAKRREDSLTALGMDARGRRAKKPR